MPQQQSQALLMFAKHADADDVTDVPGAFMHLRPLRHTFMRPDMVRLQNTGVHPQNAHARPLRGPLDLSGSYELEQIIRGLSGNVGAAIDPETTTDIAGILDVIAGTDSIDPAGAATTATETGSDGSTNTLVVAEQARFPVGSVVKFQAPAGTWHVRQVRARAGASGAGALTLDRPWTGTVADGETVIRAARWKFDPAVFSHVHGCFRAMYAANEGETFLGCMGKAVIDFERGRFGRIISTWRASDVQRATGAVPAYSAATVGNGVVRVNNSLWLGDTIYRATNVRIDCGGDLEEFGIDDAVHGTHGYLVHKGPERARPKLTATLAARGSGTGEVSEATMQTLQGWDLDAGEMLGAHDVAVQAGGTADGMPFTYGVFPGGVVTKATPTTLNGLRAVDIEVEAFETGSADLAPFEFHVG